MEEDVCLNYLVGREIIKKILFGRVIIRVVD